MFTPVFILLLHPAVRRLLKFIKLMQRGFFFWKGVQISLRGGRSGRFCFQTALDLPVCQRSDPNLLLQGGQKQKIMNQRMVPSYREPDV